MLVGHSYGAIVISVASTGNDQVRALVFLNGWTLDEGETQLQLLDRFEGSLVGPARGMLLILDRLQRLRAVRPGWGGPLVQSRVAGVIICRDRLLDREDQRSGGRHLWVGR